MRIIAQEMIGETSLSTEQQLGRLALESSVISNVVEIFRDTLPSLQRDLKNAYHGLTESDELTKDVKVGLSHFTNVERRLPNAVFLDYSQTVVSVPEGFKGEILPYLDFLNGKTDELFLGANEIIGAYKVVLATFISDKENRTSLKDHTDLYLRVQKRREEIVEEITRFFPKSTVNTKQRLSDVMGRFSDLPAIAKQMEKLNDSRRKNNLKTLSNSVREVSDLLDIIVEDVQNQGVAKVSGAAAMNVSKGAYELGKFVEIVAVFRAMVDQAVATTSKLMVQMDRII